MPLADSDRLHIVNTKGSIRDMLDRLHRDIVEQNLAMAKLLAHFGIEDVSEEEVDKALREEGLSPARATPVSPPSSTSRSSTG